MKTVKNSDIRFELNPRIVYVPSFEMKFYTVSQKEYYFKKTDEDVTEAEVSGETKYYLDLDWSQLKYIGKGVLNYQCVNNIADPSFPDGEYNQLIEKTTDYFIDTFTVNPDDDEESVIELIEKEEEERKEADAELQGNIDAEESARTAADEALSGALDTKLDVTAYTPTDLTNYYTKDETSGKTELDTAFAAKLDATAYTPTDLSNYYTKDETSGKTEIATALSGKSDTGHTHDERYYKKDETSGATELEAALDRKLDASAYTPTDLSNYYTKDETSGKSEIASAITDEASARTAADEALSGAVDTALLGYINDAAYVSTAKTINLLHGSTVIASIDATDFIKDGMVDNVVISGGSLVITFNTDSGKEAITIALTDIFDPANYYTKTEIDGIVSGKADTTAVTQAITEATSGKANSSDVYTKSETSGKTEIATALSAKLDTTAYTPTDLTNYYTKSETSGKTEISTALGTKQDTLVAGENITISGNVISAAGGDLSNYYTKAEVDEMSEVAAQAINELNEDKLDAAFSGYVTTDTEQTISGRKIFTYRNNSGSKAIEFKQTADSNKVGFSIKNSADTNNEVASFEFRPNTFTIDGVKHPLMYFGHYRNTNTAAAGVPQTVIGFRQYDQTNAAAFHYLMPLPEKAKTPFSLTTSFKDFYAPLGFKVNTGGTMVSADETGVVDLSSYIGGGGSSINVVQTTGTSTGDVMSQDAVTTQLNGKGDAISFDLVGSPVKRVTFQMKRGGINGTTISSRNLRLGRGLVYGEEGIDTLSTSGLVETSAITTSVTSASTDSQVPSAKAVYDALQGGGGNDVVELTQAEYDELVTGGTVDPDVFYIITDATAIDLSQYWTSAQTQSAITQSVSGKQDTLSAGTGIDITSNVISVTGGGSVTIDPTLDSGSTNAVANSAITTAINAKADKSTAGGGLNASNKNGFSVINLSNQNGQAISGFYKVFGVSKINNKSIVIQGEQNPGAFSLVETSAITSAITSSSTDDQVPSAKAVNDKLGGLSIVQVTQAQYDALVSGGTIDNTTLYVIVN